MNNEVELVLVDDNNDLVDPLDLGCDYDHMHNEEKFQLDDDIEIEEQTFYLNLDEVPNDAIDNERDIHSTPSKCHNAGKSKTAELERTTSMDSFDYVDAYDDTDSDDYFIDEIEPEIEPKAEMKPSTKSTNTTESIKSDTPTTSNLNVISH